MGVTEDGFYDLFNEPEEPSSPVVPDYDLFNEAEGPISPEVGDTSQSTEMAPPSPATEDYDLFNEPEPTVQEPVVSSLPISRADAYKAARQAEEEAPSATADDIRNDPAAMADIRNYMVRRKGVHLADLPDDELYDTFVNQMRFFNTNEVSTAGELRWMYGLDDEDKAIAAKAYATYDRLGNVFTNDGFWGGVNGVADYVGAAITSPSTWIGLFTGGSGGAAVKGGSVLAKEAGVQVAAKAAQRVALQQAATAGVKGAALKAAGRAAGKAVISSAIKKEAVKQVLKATAIDASLAGLQDYLYQSTLIDSGAQDHYSLLETAIATTGGMIGGAVSIVPLATKATSKLSNTAQALQVGQNRAAAKYQQKAGPAVTAMAKEMKEQFQKQMIDYKAAVERGLISTEDSLDLQKVAKTVLLGTADKENPGLIIKFMKQAGILIDKSENAAADIHQMVSFARSLPEKQLDELDVTFKETLGKTYREFTDIMAHYASDSGSTLQTIRLAGDAINKQVTAEAVANKSINELAKAPAKKGAKGAAKEYEPHVVKYVQSLWRRMLVSHPATTAVNVKGWAGASAFRALAETLHGGVLGTVGLASKLTSPITGSKFGDEALRQSGHLFSSQVFKLRNLFDPYTTREAAEALFSQAPKSAQKDLSANIFGGIEFDTAVHYGMNPNSRVIRNAERIADNAAKISGLKIQDVYTKSFSMMGEMDKQVRLKFNVPLYKMVADGRVGEIPDDIWRKALNTSLEDTFSMDYTKGFGNLSPMAKAVETVSNAPFLGFIFPFGRFMNNSLAFTMQYSPLASYHVWAKAKNKGFFKDGVVSGVGKSLVDQEVMMGTSKMLVGAIAIVGLANQQKEQRKQGLSWQQVTDSTGSVVNKENVSPLSTYMALGRVAEIIMSGETPGKELMGEVVKQLGSLALMKEVAAPQAILDTAGYMLSLGDDEAEIKSFGSFLLQLAGTSLSEIGSGFTRPLEPINAAVGMLNGKDETPDRKLSRGVDGVIDNSLRYLNNIFAPFLSEDGRTAPPRQQADKYGPVKEVNPIARMLGDRLDQQTTYINKMLAMVDKPSWRIQESTGIPEWNNLVNKMITPKLDARAKALLNSAPWKNADLSRRRRLVENLLAEVRKEARNEIAVGSGSGELYDARRQFILLDESLRAEAKHSLNILVEDRDLSLFQIELLTRYVKDQKEFEKSMTK